MSVPTSRTSRSPFSRRPRSSAAVPGAPEAVTTTVIGFRATGLAVRRDVSRTRRSVREDRGPAASDPTSRSNPGRRSSPSPEPVRVISAAIGGRCAIVEQPAALARPRARSRRRAARSRSHRGGRAEVPTRLAWSSGRSGTQKFGRRGRDRGGAAPVPRGPSRSVRPASRRRRRHSARRDRCDRSPHPSAVRPTMRCHSCTVVRRLESRLRVVHRPAAGAPSSRRRPHRHAGTGRAQRLAFEERQDLSRPRSSIPSTRGRLRNRPSRSGAAARALRGMRVRRGGEPCRRRARRSR